MVKQILSNNNKSATEIFKKNQFHLQYVASRLKRKKRFEASAK
jgi:hypothetical protein